MTKTEFCYSSILPLPIHIPTTNFCATIQNTLWTLNHTTYAYQIINWQNREKLAEHRRANYESCLRREDIYAIPGFDTNIVLK